MKTVEPGDLVWIALKGDRGGGKRWPVVVISVKGASVVGVGVTASAIDSTLWPFVPLPYHPGRNVSTRLDKPAWAVCDWLTQFDMDEIVERKGYVPRELLKDIRHKVGQG